MARFAAVPFEWSDDQAEVYQREQGACGYTRGWSESKLSEFGGQAPELPATWEEEGCPPPTPDLPAMTDAPIPRSAALQFLTQLAQGATGDVQARIEAAIATIAAGEPIAGVG